MIIGKDKLKITPNSYHILPKNEPHEYRSDTDDPWSIYWMHFNGKATGQLYQRYLEQRNTNGSVSYESHRIDLFNEIFNMYKSEYTIPKLEFANILALQFISTFIYSSKEIAVESTLHTNLINSIIDFLNENLDKTFKADEIAEQFKCSPSYLFNLFKKRTGYSIIHFFNLKKIQKACEYLKYTELSIKQISYKVGIQDPLYFSRTFKNILAFPQKTIEKNSVIDSNVNTILIPSRFIKKQRLSIPYFNNSIFLFLLYFDHKNMILSI